MVEVFRAVRRVLRDDGTCWVNLGDSYTGGGGFCATAPSTATSKSGKYGTAGAAMKSVGEVEGLRPKNLVGIPWRVAFALQADGWWLRQDIIWHKPNPMPESVRDRCTKAHEYIFLLSKGAVYHYDAKAICEPSVTAHVVRKRASTFKKQATQGRHGGGAAEFTNPTRNRRSVWTVTPKPFKGAHFATFPPALIEPCILAGCPVGGTVLDPFGGSGTTAGVAVAHGRKAILCELSSEYAQLIPDRVARVAAAIRGRKSQGREVGLRHD
jgi:site-specific DNA-methyltransferase (adenine-specific)